MEITKKIEFEREDVESILCAEFRRILGDPPAGYAVRASDSYGIYTVTLYKLPAAIPTEVVPETAVVAQN